MADVEALSPRLAPDSPLARALDRGRERFNARVAMARRQGRRIDSSALSRHLIEVAAPIVAAVELVDARCVDTVSEALFDLSMNLVARDVLGPASRSPWTVEAWRSLLPCLAARIAERPSQVVAALTNAAYNLGLEPSVRTRDWLSWMGEIGPRCATVDELLSCGKVLAWRSGMAHLRETALHAWEQLPRPLALASLGLPAGSSATREVLRSELADPWRVPGTPVAPSRLKIVGPLGGFRGFGGPFLDPPRVFALAGRLVVADSAQAWSLHADCFGRILVRSSVAADERGQRGPATLEGDGTVRFAGLREKFPELAQASSYASSETVLAVARRRTHRLLLVARAGGAAA